MPNANQISKGLKKLTASGLNAEWSSLKSKKVFKTTARISGGNFQEYCDFLSQLLSDNSAESKKVKDKIKQYTGSTKAPNILAPQIKLASPAIAQITNSDQEGDEASEFEARLEKQNTDINKASGTPEGDAAKLKASEASDFAKKEDFVRANALLDEAQSLLEGADDDDEEDDGEPLISPDKLALFMKNAKKKQHSFACGIGNAGFAYTMNKVDKKPKTLASKLRKQAGAKKSSFGFVTLEGKTLVLDILNKPLPNLARKMKVWLKENKPLPAKKVRLLENGVEIKLTDEELAEEMADLPGELLEYETLVMKALISEAGDAKKLEAVWAFVNNKAKARDYSATMQGLGKLDELLEAADANPEEIEWNAGQEALASLFAKAISLKPANQTKLEAAWAMATKRADGGDYKTALAIASKLKPALEAITNNAPAASGQSEASPDDSARKQEVQALESRMAKIAKEQVPTMLERQKALTLKNAKGLVDNDKLDEARKLLDTLETQLARTDKAPKADDWSEKNRELELQKRMEKVAKEKVPAMLVRQKAQTLQKAKGLVDNGKLDEARKLLDTLEAQLARTGQAPNLYDSPEKSEKLDALQKRMEKVEKAKFTNLDPKAMQKAKGLVGFGKLDEANKLLDELVAKAMGDLKFEGVDFSNDAQMKGVYEKISEELFAYSELINEKMEKMNEDQKKEWVSIQNRCLSVINEGIGANEGRIGGYKIMNEEVVKDALEKFEGLVPKKRKLQSELKPLWKKDQTERFDKELEKNKQSSSKAMQEIFGDDFMEMALMAEVMAKKKAFDPFEVSEDSKDGFKGPMEMGEVAAIYGYSTADYTKINGLLRDAENGEIKDKKIDPYIDACKNGLKKLPPYTGTVHRMDKNAKYFLPELLSSGKRTEKGFFSTGPKAVPGPFGNLESIITKVKTGKDITAFSLHQGEGEVLFPPGSVFKFDRFESKDKDIVIRDHTKLKGVVDENTAEGTFYFEQTK